ncbi:predicted protein [Chaetoceros tenuissimus]|uniref:Uncharacterized protein n=1 Tax=Chaetoceros tenuissimus TaxID=426638 RepID=A0AAD3CZF9_9STRA|nr:predicted protein [Chaetoceros tenuissimus]
MKLLTASKLLVLPFLASINAVQAVVEEKDMASKANNSSSSIQKNLRDHRALYQQKLNDLENIIKKKARTLELSAETQKLLECYDSVEPKWVEDLAYDSVTYTVRKKDYDEAILHFGEEDLCPGGSKEISLRDHVYCETPYGGLMVRNEKKCIQDDDACPEDYSTLVALEIENEEGYDPGFYFFFVAYYTQETCLLQQCFPKSTRERTFTITDPDDVPISPYTCPEIGGTCEVDCEDDENFVCVSGLCYSNKDFDEDLFLSLTGSDDTAEADGKPSRTFDLHHLKHGDVVDGKRKLKATKAPKGSKAPKKAGKGKCICKVPRIQQD